MGTSALAAVHEFEETRSKRSSFCGVTSRQSCFGSTPFDKGEFAIHKCVGIPRGRISPDAMRYLDSTETHLLFAAGQQNSQLLRHLLAQGAKVNTYDENRTSPLHIACRQGNTEVVQLLLEHGAAVNITDCAGWSPLHVASYCQRSETVWMLLEHEADPTICNARGETPWDIASDAETQTVFKEFYRENDHPVAEVIELESSTQKQLVRSIHPSTDVDAYIPGPLNLSALESSLVHEALFPISKPANESVGDMINVSYAATPISERSEDGVLEPYS